MDRNLFDRVIEASSRVCACAWLRFQLVPALVIVPHNYGIGNRLLNRRDDKKKSVMGYELLVLISQAAISRKSTETMAIISTF